MLAAQRVKFRPEATEKTDKFSGFKCLYLGAIWVSVVGFPPESASICDTATVPLLREICG